MTNKIHVNNLFLGGGGWTGFKRLVPLKSGISLKNCSQKITLFDKNKHQQQQHSILGWNSDIIGVSVNLCGAG